VSSVKCQVKKFCLLAMVLAVCLLLALPLSARNKQKDADAETAAPAAADLAMPSGWSDNMLDQLTKGQDPRRTVAVLEFEGAEKFYKLEDLGLNGRSLSDMAITYLTNTGKFNVVERSRLDKVMKEQELQLSDQVASQVAEVGRLVGADAVVFGIVTGASDEVVPKVSFKLLQFKVTVDMRCVDTSTGKVVYAEQSLGQVDKKIIEDSRGNVVSGNINSQDEYSAALKRAIGDSVKKIAAKFPLLGYVVSVDGKQVITDVGSTRGVQAGSNFIVFRKGAQIIHPATGKPIGWNKQIIAAIQIDSSEETMSTGRVMALKSPQVEPQAGDLVILK
jgi:curli biogenesis system outer membrane secretion channel CsgG